MYGPFLSFDQNLKIHFPNIHYESKRKLQKAIQSAAGLISVIYNFKSLEAFKRKGQNVSHPPFLNSRITKPGENRSYKTKGTVLTKHNRQTSLIDISYRFLSNKYLFSQKELLPFEWNLSASDLSIMPGCI